MAPREHQFIATAPQLSLRSTAVETGSSHDNGGGLGDGELWC